MVLLLAVPAIFFALAALLFVAAVVLLSWTRQHRVLRQIRSDRVGFSKGKVR